VLTEFTVSGAWEGLNSRWILIDKNGNKTDHTFVQRLYSAAELRNILIKECKFKTAEVYGGFNKENYDQNLSTMVIVCKK
ncbi:MAG: class I SAM-dependent methyltransferase, partial [Treponema sp.]|nr:class I SAM-dependent methyltransferase [Treponema sp.]